MRVGIGINQISVRKEFLLLVSAEVRLPNNEFGGMIEERPQFLDVALGSDVH